MERTAWDSLLLDFRRAHPFQTGTDLGVYAAEEALFCKIIPQDSGIRAMTFVQGKDWYTGGIFLNNLTRAHLRLLDFAKGSEQASVLAERLSQVEDLEARSLATQEVIVRLEHGERDLDVERIIEMAVHRGGDAAT